MRYVHMETGLFVNVSREEKWSEWTTIEGHTDRVLLETTLKTDGGQEAIAKDPDVLIEDWPVVLLVGGVDRAIELVCAGDQIPA